VKLYGSHVNGDSYEWDFGDGSISISISPSHIYAYPGEYEVTFEVYNIQYTCSVSQSKMVYIYPKPEINPSQDVEICLGDGIQLHAEGGIEYLWWPDTFINDVSLPNPTVNPDVSIDYSVKVTDVHTCSDTATIPVFVQQEPVFSQSDTFSIVVGDVLDITGEPLYNVEYLWAPPELVLCPTCINPGFMPLLPTTFYLSMNAYAGNNLCFSKYDSLFVWVDWKFSIDAPDLFTPNGDGNNDVIMVRGWGIKELHEFRIYNRWGQEVFFTDDKNTGWDGQYNGQAQPIDTYSYMAKVLTYEGNILVKNGVFTLMR
jgi:gliding motility-associated-like protein